MTISTCTVQSQSERQCCCRFHGRNLLATRRTKKVRRVWQNQPLGPLCHRAPSHSLHRTTPNNHRIQRRMHRRRRSRQTNSRPAASILHRRDPTQDGIYEPFQVDINASINVTTANEQLIALNVTCPSKPHRVRRPNDRHHGHAGEGANDLLVCSRPQGSTQKDGVWRHLHGCPSPPPSLFGAYLSPSPSRAFRRPNNAHRRIRLRPLISDARHCHEKHRGCQERSTTPRSKSGTNCSGSASKNGGVIP